MIHKHILVTGEAGHGKDTVANRLSEKYGYKTVAFADLQKQEVINSYAHAPKTVDIEWLNIRETKETPDFRLALEHCSDKNFVSVAMKIYDTEDRELHIRIRDAEHSKFIDEQTASLIRNQSKSIASGADCFSEDERLRLPRSPRRITQVWGTEYRRLSKFGHDQYWIEPINTMVHESVTPFVVTDGRTQDEIDWAAHAGLQRIEVVRPGAPSKVANHITEMIPPIDSNTIVLMNDSTLEGLYKKMDDDAAPRIMISTPRTSMRPKP